MGQLLDRSIALFRRNFLTFVGIVALVQVPVSLLQLLFNLGTQGIGLSGFGGSDLANTLMAGAAVTTLLVGLLGSLLLQIGTGALARAIGNEYLGVDISILEAYRQIRGQWRSLIGLIFLGIILYIGLLLWLLIPCIGWVTGPSILFFWTSVIVPLGAPIVVLERQRAQPALRRAWDVARRRFWWVLGFILLLFVFELFVVTGPTVVVASLGELLLGEGSFGNSMAAYVTIEQTANLLFSLLFTPLKLTAIIMMYFDLRVRTEGFDLLVDADRGADTGISVEALIANAPAAQSDQLVTGEELGKFAILTFLVVAFAVALAAVLALFSGLLA
jgi:hypothetical protein